RRRNSSRAGKCKRCASARWRRCAPSGRRAPRARSTRRPGPATACCAGWRGRADSGMPGVQGNGYDELGRRLAAAGRSAALSSPAPPLVQRGVDALTALCASISQKTDAIVIGFIGDEVVVNAQRLPKSAAALVGFARDMREREIEKITLQRGVTREELRALVFEVADRRATLPLASRLQ